MILAREAGDDVTAAEALGRLHNVTSEQGDLADAETLLQDCLSAWRKSGAIAGFVSSFAESLLAAGYDAFEQGDYQRAAARLQEALTVAKELHIARAQSTCLQYLAMVARARGRLGEARCFLDEALSISGTLGDARNIGGATNVRGLIAWTRGISRRPCAQPGVSRVSAIRSCLSMSTYLEVWASGTSAMVPLDAFRLTLGRAEDNDVVLADRRVSAVHLLFERIGPHWSVRDVGSRNGTIVNGERLLAERFLQSGDEIRVGGSRLVYRSAAAPASPTTAGTTAAPTLTRREKDVLIALCRPLAEGSLLTEPASVAAIAAELVLTDSAVKKHISNLYDKFGLYDEDRRRGRLANEAIARGAVRVAELRSPT